MRIQRVQWSYKKNACMSSENTCRMLQLRDRPFLCICVMPGAICDFRLGYGRVLSRRSKIIAINRDKDQLLKVRNRSLHTLSE